MMYRLLLFVLFAAGAQALTVPAAHACKCNYAMLQSSFPEQDERGVEIDIAPLMFFVGSLSSTAVAWQSVDGEPVEFESRKGRIGRLCSGVLELVPKRALRANTGYEITLTHNNAEQTLRFTTGERVVAEQPAGPSARVRVERTAPGRRDSCTSGDLACIDVGPAFTELLIPGRSRDEFWGIARGENPAIDLPRDTECIELRTRNRAGRRSEALRLCGDKLNVRVQRDDEPYQLQASCEDDAREGEKAGDAGESSGRPDDLSDGEVEESCSARPLPLGRSSTISFAALSLAFVAFVRRRRRATRRKARSTG